jgi:hypothetical protein
MSEEKEQYIPSPGKLRPNQIITTFGPGSIIQLQHDSVLVMGIDFWAHKSEYPIKHHHYLEKICRKEHFRMPMVSDSKQNVVSCRSFPSWGFCPYCKKLQKHESLPSRGIEFRCEKHSWNELLPARFILTCENGHLEEFPWNEWAHIKDLAKNDYTVEICDKPDLRWYSSEKSSSISDSRIHCINCKKGNFVGKAFAPEGLPTSFKKCSGQIPWLEKSQKCIQSNGDNDSGQTTEPVMRAVLGRSSSIYYPQTITGLIIPELRHEIAQEIMKSDFKAGLNAMRENAGWTLEQIAEKYKSLDDLRATYGVEKMKDFLEKIYGDNPKITEASTEFDLRDIEYHDIMDTDFPGDDEIKIESVDISNGSAIEHISQLKKFHRLAVLKVLRYFTRIRPPNPLESEKEIGTRICHVGKSSTRKWLPCVANKGEGIFFSLDQNDLNSWEKLSGVKDRCKALLEGLEEWSSVKEWDKTAVITPKYVLLHSLSHVLIREIAKHAGYNEASISERIYIGDDYNAILLYTSGSSGDGSLGGLVRLGEPNEFGKILKNAIQNSRICTRDPLCIEEDAYAKKINKIPLHARLNNAACFGCMLIPETSCENFNKLLDRKLLFDQEIGFFHE